ncbi:MAG: OPT/YSL family transporter [Candidatus Thermoplasmatota archaeon]|nr:OPT/YSL family transporter [Candidatus Thermoplasmatota archaeon]
MKGELKEYSYRKPLTAEGIKAIDKGTLNYFDLEMYGNLNTGLLEEYLEEKNKREGFKTNAFVWWKVLVGLLIGIAFAAINQYVGLKIGMVVGGSWYVSYLIGMALKWKPAEMNVIAGTSNGASMVCTGFVFTFPAIYFLFYNTDTHSLSIKLPIATVIISSITAALLGMMYFIIFRRVWLVEDPLPMPGFQASIKLLDMAHDLSGGMAKQAKRSLIMVATVTGLAGAFTFLRDFPLFNGSSLFDKWFAGDGNTNYGPGGDLQQTPTIHNPGEPVQIQDYTYVNFNLSPIMLATGWFMEFKSAFLVNLGTLFSWFVVIPVSIYFNIQFPSKTGVMLTPIETAWPAGAAYSNIARIMGIGAILGGGFWGLIKMLPTFKTATADLFKLRQQKGLEGRRDYVGGKGWYEWPITHIPVMMVITLVAVSGLFIMGGFPVAGSIALGVLVAFTTFFFGAIAVKVMGETSVEPVSGTSFIVLLLLFATFKLLQIETQVAMVMALLGTTVFGGAISMAGDIVQEYKNALYVGARPYTQMKGGTLGVVPGMVVAGLAAMLFSVGLAEGKLNLVAPQGHAFEGFANILMGGNMNIWLLIIGAAVGIGMDLLTGAGTSFGLGMYFPLATSLPMLAGGIARDLWEKKWLEPKAKRENWDERKKTTTLLDTYMIATGMTVGEALVGTLVAIYLVVPLITGSGA